jgi:hypothetical protein
VTSSAQRPADRYGTPSPGRRKAGIVLIGLIVGSALAWVAWAAWFHSRPVVTSDLLSFEVLSDHEATATVKVGMRGEADEDGVRCKVQAVAADHSSVGDLSFVPQEGTNTVTVRTERRATAVTLEGCTGDGQNRPR